MPNDVAIVVEDNDSDVRLVIELLGPLGFEVIHAATILDGEDQALKIFGGAHPRTGCMIVDMHLPLPYDSQGIDGYYLISALDTAMAEGRMATVPIAAVSADWTPERWSRANYVGADCIWEKPFLASHAAILRELVDGPPANHTTMVERTTLGMLAQDLLGFMRRTRPLGKTEEVIEQLWTAADARLLVGYFTPAIRINAAEKNLIRERIGDSTAIMRQRLNQCIQWLTDQDLVLYGQCLRYLLSGVTQEAIGRRIGYRRVKLTNFLDRLYEQIALYLNSQK